MVDVFNSEQSKRLFGFISAGATLGAIVGSSITASLAMHVPATYLLVGSAALLEVAVFGVRRLSRLSDALHRHPTAHVGEAPIGGGMISGLTHAFKSAFLVNVSVYILLYAITSTFLYFQQAEIARHAFSTRGARTAFFAQIDLLVNILTLGAQLFLTAKVLRAFGVGVTLAALPVLSVLGFGTLALAPTLATLVGYQVLRRRGKFRFRPTVAGSAIHSGAARGQVQSQELYRYRRLSDRRSSGCVVLCRIEFHRVGNDRHCHRGDPLSIVWLINGLWLGRKQEALARG